MQPARMSPEAIPAASSGQPAASAALAIGAVSATFMLALMTLYSIAMLPAPAG